MLGRLLEIGGDLHVLAAPQRADFIHAGDLFGEAHAAGAVNAAGHDRLDQRAHVFLGHRALVFVIARRAAAIGDRLVLQIALTALVADRAIERVVDQQEFHHAFARGLDHFAVGADFLPVGSRQRAARLRLGRSGLHLDQAHAAIAGDRQPLVIAEARDFLARKLARLKDGCAFGDLEFLSVYGDLGHYDLTNLSRSLVSQIAMNTLSGT